MSPLDLVQQQAQQALTEAKLADLRAWMAAYQLDGYLIPSADEHLNEYLPEAKQRRTWISDFTGSAGDFLVGTEQSWLFVDSRYYEQADLQVDPAAIHVSKLGLEGHKTLVETLEALGQAAIAVQQPFRLGVDPFTVTVDQCRDLQKRLAPAGVVLVSLPENLVDRVRESAAWADGQTPASYAASRLFAVPEALTGETVAQKLERLRQAMQKAQADILPLTKLDQIAWLLNLRGWDVPYNPVFIAYTIVTAEQAFLFTNLERIDTEIQQSLQPHIALLPYEQYANTLQSLLNQPQPLRVWIDAKHTTMGTYELVQESSKTGKVQIVEAPNPVEGMKARKNAIEIEQMQQANLKASRAKVRAWKWFSDRWAAGDRVTEFDVAEAIARFYQAEPGFQGLSFNTISGAGANSSIVHYGTPNPNVDLQAGQLLLLDSGAQFLSGTTDDTRTFVVGEATREQIARYTEVLKAHINCAMQRFPKGTPGCQLDGIARSAMWQSGLDYGHGTGHGVGAFLNVHEGPNGINKRSQEPLEPGMVTSVEPGYYEPGWGGIRIENLYVIKEVVTENNGAVPKGTWYEFESLTYIPFDKHLIDCDRLSPQQREWLEHYHVQVVEKLAPTLTPDEAEWLKAACQL
ncbi:MULTISPECIES: aminopeptidase P family protein [Trichocoleus]|uniref:Aminopeptidase P family protein n=1 Tax=Trichocoleus desertorum GB2-A4 TaxID=2933944 RepID=A0ABV0JAQ9_9CYAN|nr:aminopeptidase P family protein [Trichocoleus sp. FACHB-46]MBD1863110.1 aminopeptidase P family protein [Trichocoleus sp. FACHB-46]